MIYSAFNHWVRLAAKGERCVYHTGLLMADRTFMHGVDVTAKLAYEYHEKRVVALTQRRVAAGSCDYIATRL